MLKTYKPTIAAALLTLAGAAGATLEPSAAEQGADLIVLAIGSITTLIAWVLKVWATRQANLAGGNTTGPGSGAGTLVALLLIAGMGLSLTACASRVAETPQQIVFALQSDHLVAQEAIIAYAESSVANKAVVQALNDLDKTAYASIRAAQAAVREGNDAKLPALIAAARNALGILQRRLGHEGLLGQPPPKGSSSGARPIPDQV